MGLDFGGCQPYDAPSVAWYDLFSRIYDASLEPLYREQRRLAAEALRVDSGSVVLDLPCGTGQSFPLLARNLGAAGSIVGVDLSEGMLREAQRRVDREGLASRARLLREDAAQLTASRIGATPDRLHVFLGMTVFPEPEAIFAHLWSLLAPGGRCVLVDVYAEKPNSQGKMVELIAQADLRRRFWEPLAAAGTHFSLTDLPFDPRHGGQIRMAVADKP
jgi:ubiquinone/menaquinone biosynthesis C-methylase UbiE